MNIQRNILIVLSFFALTACDSLSTESAAVEQEVSEPVRKSVSMNKSATVDVVASPENGLQSFYEDIMNNVKYPEDAKTDGIEGKVFLEFTIAETGMVSEVKVQKGIGHGCDEAALAAVSGSQKWIPAMKGGEPVASKMVLPVNFQLQ